MAPTHTLTEPHPSFTSKKTSSRAVLGSGRGGAGNYSKYSRDQLTSGPSATGPATRAANVPTTTQPTEASSGSRTTTSSKKIFSGIGGAGNAHASSSRGIFSFDDELERQQRCADSSTRTPVYLVGRGGAGNTYDTRRADTSFFAEKDGNGKGRQTSAASVSSAGSEDAMGKAKKSFEGVRGKVVRALSGRD